MRSPEWANRQKPFLNDRDMMSKVNGYCVLCERSDRPWGQKAIFWLYLRVMLFRSQLDKARLIISITGLCEIGLDRQNIVRSFPEGWTTIWRHLSSPIVMYRDEHLQLIQKSFMSFQNLSSRERISNLTEQIWLMIDWRSNLLDTTIGFSSGAS